MRTVMILAGVGILLILGALLDAHSRVPCPPGACGPTDAEVILYVGLAFLGLAAVRLVWIVARPRTR